VVGVVERDLRLPVVDHGHRPDPRHPTPMVSWPVLGMAGTEDPFAELEGLSVEPWVRLIATRPPGWLLEPIVGRVALL
jgi:hypothetical protein